MSTAQLAEKTGAGARVDFATDPARYRHWKLTIDGRVARLAMDVSESATLAPNQEIRMIAKPRKRFPPIATNMSEWRVNSSVID